MELHLPQLIYCYLMSKRALKNLKEHRWIKIVILTHLIRLIKVSRETITSLIIYEKMLVKPTNHLI